MTNGELGELREVLEETLALDTLPRYARPREELTGTLAEVIAEQGQRAGTGAGPASGELEGAP